MLHAPPKALAKPILVQPKTLARQKTPALLKSNVVPAIHVPPKTLVQRKILAPQKRAKAYSV